MEQALRRKRQEITAFVESTRERERELYRHVGIGICGSEQTPDEKYEPLLARFREHQGAVDTAASTIESMVSAESRLEEIKRERETIRSNRKEVDAECVPVYREVGRVAFGLFREQRLIDSAFGAIFADLAQFQDRVDEIERKRQETQNTESRNLVQRIVAKGEQLVLDGRRASRENQLPRLLLEAGRAVYEGDFISRIDDPALNRTVEPLRDIGARLATLARTEEKLLSEEEALGLKLKEATGGKRIGRAREQREAEIAELQAEMADVTIQIGEVACENHLPGIEDQLERLNEIRAERKKAQGDLAKIDAALEELRLNAKTEALETRAAELEERAASIEEQRRSVLEEIAETQKAAKQAARKRGNAYSLIDK